MLTHGAAAEDLEPTEPPLATQHNFGLPPGNKHKEAAATPSPLSAAPDSAEGTAGPPGRCRPRPGEQVRRRGSTATAPDQGRQPTPGQALDCGARGVGPARPCQ